MMRRLKHSAQTYVWGLAFLVIVDWLWPVSYWLRVENVYVNDATAYTQPVLSVKRKINRPFEASWRVELERETEDGFEFVKSATGSNRYGTASRLPAPLYLDWWTYPIVWDLEPGRYQIETCWALDVGLIQPKRICKTSNTFTIR